MPSINTQNTGLKEILLQKSAITRFEQDQPNKMPRRYNHLDGNYFRGKGHTYFAAEEALGIGLFILVLAILLAFGCWYYKRRSGYKSLRSKRSSVSTIQNVVGEGEILDCKMPLQEYRAFNSVVPDAPPAYDKIAADQSPPPYSP